MITAILTIRAFDQMTTSSTFSGTSMASGCMAPAKDLTDTKVASLRRSISSRPGLRTTFSVPFAMSLRDKPPILLLWTVLPPVLHLVIASQRQQLSSLLQDHPARVLRLVKAIRHAEIVKLDSS